VEALDTLYISSSTAITADGGTGLGLSDAPGGGGSGGSVWLVAGRHVDGTGFVTARGGNAPGGYSPGCGGGGRIALHVGDTLAETIDLDASAGSSGCYAGHAGTVWVNVAGQPTLRVDARGRTNWHPTHANREYTRLPAGLDVATSASATSLHWLIVERNARLWLPNATTIAPDHLWVETGSLLGDNYTVRAVTASVWGTVSASHSLRLEQKPLSQTTRRVPPLGSSSVSAACDDGQSRHFFRFLSGSFLECTGYLCDVSVYLPEGALMTAAGSNVRGASLDVSVWRAWISTTWDASDRGFASDEGPGTPRRPNVGGSIRCYTSCWSAGAGASHGGRGTWGVYTLSGSEPVCPRSSPGETYGSAVDPFEFGSGGASGMLPGGIMDTAGARGGRGGGRVRIVATDHLHFASAAINVDGGPPTVNGTTSGYFYGGAGSGGSISVHARKLTTTGPTTLRAWGGHGHGYGAGGGGGRIAVHASHRWHTPDLMLQAFTHTSVGQYGASGTVFVDMGGWREVWIDANGYADSRTVEGGSHVPAATEVYTPWPAHLPWDLDAVYLRRSARLRVMDAAPLQALYLRADSGTTLLAENGTLALLSSHVDGALIRATGRLTVTDAPFRSSAQVLLSRNSQCRGAPGTADRRYNFTTYYGAQEVFNYGGRIEDLQDDDQYTGIRTDPSDWIEFDFGEPVTISHIVARPLRGPDTSDPWYQYLNSRSFYVANVSSTTTDIYPSWYTQVAIVPGYTGSNRNSRTVMELSTSAAPISRAPVTARYWRLTPGGSSYVALGDIDFYCGGGPPVHLWENSATVACSDVYCRVEVDLGATDEALLQMQSYTIVRGANITLMAPNITLDEATIDANWRGHPGSVGPGAPVLAPGLNSGCISGRTHGSGAGYGGESGRALNPWSADCDAAVGVRVAPRGMPYDVERVAAPSAFGSGGGHGWSSASLLPNGRGGFGGAGGGIITVLGRRAVRLNRHDSSVGSYLMMTASGESGHWDPVTSTYGGSGSGGSIYVRAPVITGAGRLEAIGGGGYSNTDSGGGAGGRIALVADQFLSASIFGDANGAGCSNCLHAMGAAGTVWMEARAAGWSKLWIEGYAASWQSPSARTPVPRMESAGAAAVLRNVTEVAIQHGTTAAVYADAALEARFLHLSYDGHVVPWTAAPLWSDDASARVHVSVDAARVEGQIMGSHSVLFLSRARAGRTDTFPTLLNRANRTMDFISSAVVSCAQPLCRVEWHTPAAQVQLTGRIFASSVNVTAYTFDLMSGGQVLLNWRGFSRDTGPGVGQNFTTARGLSYSWYDGGACASYGSGAGGSHASLGGPSCYKLLDCHRCLKRVRSDRVRRRGGGALRGVRVHVPPERRD
jgi:hypothetical protein